MARGLAGRGRGKARAVAAVVSGGHSAAAPLSAHPGFQSQIKVMRGNVALSDAEIDALVCP